MVNMTVNHHIKQIRLWNLIIGQTVKKKTFMVTKIIYLHDISMHTKTTGKLINSLWFRIMWQFEANHSSRFINTPFTFPFKFKVNFLAFPRVVYVIVVAFCFEVHFVNSFAELLVRCLIFTILIQNESGHLVFC